MNGGSVAVAAAQFLAAAAGSRLHDALDEWRNGDPGDGGYVQLTVPRDLLVRLAQAVDAYPDMLHHYARERARADRAIMRDALTILAGSANVRLDEVAKGLAAGASLEVMARRVDQAMRHVDSARVPDDADTRRLLAEAAVCAARILDGSPVD